MINIYQFGRIIIDNATYIIIYFNLFYPIFFSFGNNILVKIWQKLARDNGVNYGIKKYLPRRGNGIIEKSIIQAIVIAPQSNYRIISHHEANLRIAERKIFSI